MAERAANLVDFVIPYVPNRQWVLSLPFALRYCMAWELHSLAAMLVAEQFEDVCPPPRTTAG